MQPGGARISLRGSYRALASHPLDRMAPPRQRRIRYSHEPAESGLSHSMQERMKNLGRG
jgi:hypothetical protein